MGEKILQTLLPVCNEKAFSLQYERKEYGYTDMKPAKNTVLLELHVPDFEIVREYYGKLGFKVTRETEPDEKKGYLVLRMENNILRFWAGNEYVYEHSYFSQFPKDTMRGYGIEIVLMVADVEIYYEKVKGFANVVQPLSVRPWGLQDFRVVDPFGYYIRITSLHDIFHEAKSGKSM